MLNKDQLMFVEQMSEIYAKSNQRESLTEFSAKLIEQIINANDLSRYAQVVGRARRDNEASLITHVTGSQCSPEDFEELAEEIDSIGSNVVAAMDKPARNTSLIAPPPTVPDMPDNYDPLVAVSLLPHSDNLPQKFGTTDYSAIRYDADTVILSNEHYQDFLYVRNECKDLREHVARLDTLMTESSRRHVALDKLVNAGVSIFHIDGVYTVVCGTDMKRITGASLTECLESTVEHLATATATESKDEGIL